MQKDTTDQMQEEAILITLLEIPSFREKAGLPPRREATCTGSVMHYTTGETLDTISRVTGRAKQTIDYWEKRALAKLSRTPLALALLEELRAQRA